MKRSVHALWSVILLAVTGASTTSAEDAAENLRACVNEPDDARRLQCYDTEMARQAASTSNAQLADSTPAATAPLSAEERFGLNDEQAREKENIDESPKLDRLSTTVTSIARRPQGELAMTLGNGQVWVQKQATSFDVRVGERVTIKTAALGSFLMSNASGRSTRVTRVH